MPPSLAALGMPHLPKAEKGTGSRHSPDKSKPKKETSATESPYTHQKTKRACSPSSADHHHPPTHGQSLPEPPKVECHPFRATGYPGRIRLSQVFTELNDVRVRLSVLRLFHGANLRKERSMMKKLRADASNRLLKQAGWAKNRSPARKIGVEHSVTVAQFREVSPSC